MIEKKEHLTLEGLHKFVAIKAIMNRGRLSEELEKYFIVQDQQLNSIVRPVVTD